MLTLRVERTLDRRNVEQRLVEAEAQVQALRRRVNELTWALLSERARRMRLEQALREEGVHVSD